MYAMQLASGTPSALVDWNNNYGDEDDKCVLVPLRQLGEALPARHRDRHGANPGHRRSAIENTYGALEGRTPAGPAHLLLASPPTMSDGEIGAYRRRRRIHRRRAGNLRHPRRGRDPRVARTDALHLPERLRAPRRHEPIAHGRSPRGGIHHISWLGYLRPWTAGVIGDDGAWGSTVYSRQCPESVEMCRNVSNPVEPAFWGEPQNETEAQFNSVPRRHTGSLLSKVASAAK